MSMSRQQQATVKIAPPTYRQKKIPHKDHLMATYPDGNFRFCRYYGCGHQEHWDTTQARWVAGRATGRRKPTLAILRELPQQLEMFPVTNEEAARAFVMGAGRRNRKRAIA